MLSPADADLVGRDPGLPGLVLLLDADALLEELRTLLPDAALLGITSHYLRYKPSTNCLVAYRLRTASGEYGVYAKAHTHQAREKLQKARARVCAPEALALGRAALDRSAVVVSAFPNDDKVPALKTWNDARRHRRMIRRVIRHTHIGEMPSEILRYKPERRIVARVTAEDGKRIVIRGCLPGDFERTAAGASAFRSRGNLSVASCLGASVRDSAVGIEWLDGMSLDDALAQTIDASVLASVGAALADAHSQPITSLHVRTVEDQARRLRAVGTFVAFLCPPLAGRIARAMPRLLGALQAESLRPIHGDFHPRQVVLTDGSIGFIDFDEAAMGHPLGDVASFLAHLERDVLAQRQSRAIVDAAAAAFIDGYRKVSAAVSFDGLDAHVAASLLLLAPHPFRDREPCWTDGIAQIVERVVELADRCSTRGLPFTPLPSDSSDRGDRSVPVIDPFDVPFDPALRWASAALTATHVEARLNPLLQHCELARSAHITRIEVVRHRPGRRCVVEYMMQAADTAREFRILGKMQRRRVDRDVYDAIELLRAHGLHGEGAMDVGVPKPLGEIPEWRMWLQVRAGGSPATAHLANPSSDQLGRRIAEAIGQVHASGVRVARRHTIDDEIEILRRRLHEVSAARPAYARRLAQVYSDCRSVASSLRSADETLIHRDFYQDQVIVDGHRLWLVDFDLCCMGDPSLDAGNFIAHVIEQQLRSGASATSFDRAQRAFRARFLELAGGDRAVAVDIYTTLTLARHIWISTRMPERRAATLGLLELTEARLRLHSEAQPLVTEITS